MPCVNHTVIYGWILFVAELATCLNLKVAGDLSPRFSLVKYVKCTLELEKTNGNLISWKVTYHSDDHMSQQFPQ